MPSHMSDIGFQLNSEDEFHQLASQAREEGEALEADNGTYIRWAAGEGIECWWAHSIEIMNSSALIHIFGERV